MPRWAVRGNRQRTAALVVILACSCNAYAHAQQQESTGPLPSVQVHVRPLRDAGGLPDAGTNGQPVNERLGRALEIYLADVANGRYVVIDPSGKPVPPLPKSTAGGDMTAKSLPTAVFSVEGELSHVESAEAEGGAYLCALRLFKEGSPRRLLGQWAGTAASLRYLTGNLRSVPDVDNAGLVGEIGKRLAQQIVAFSGPDQATQLAGIVASAPARPSLKMIVDGKPAAAEPSLANGTRYQVDIAPPTGGTVYAVLIDARGNARALEVPDAAHEIKIEAGQHLLMPAKDRSATADSSYGSPQSVVILIRKEKSGTVTQPRQVGGGDNPDTAAPGGPVRILEGGATRTARVDPAVARLLDMAGADPPGTWLAARLDFKVTTPN